ncbi:TolC family protein [Cupriavidus basilensis]
MGGRREDMVSLTVAINLPLWRGSKLGPRVAEATAMRDQTTSMLQAQQNEVSSRLRQETANVEQNFKSARLYRAHSTAAGAADRGVLTRGLPRESCGFLYAA